MHGTTEQYRYESIRCHYLHLIHFHCHSNHIYSGYMAPEYAMEGVFSIKSDVYSFGILMLEVISGRKNSGFFKVDNAKNLLSQVRFFPSLWNKINFLGFVRARILQ